MNTEVADPLETITQRTVPAAGTAAPTGSVASSVFALANGGRGEPDDEAQPQGLTWLEHARRSFDACGALPITRVVFADTGQHAVASYWMPTAAELALLNAGKSVRLSVLGRTHPPLYVGVDGDGLI